MRPFSDNQFQPIKNLTTAIIVLLAIQAAAHALQTLLCIGELVSPNKFELEDGTVTSAWIMGMALVFTLHFPVYLACAVFFLIWQHRAYKNLSALVRSAALDTTPGWAVAYWVIPIISLFKPYLTMREMWRKSEPDVDASSSTPPETPAALIFWWAFYIISQIAAQIAMRVDILDKSADMANVALLHGVRSFLTLIAAVLAILVVKSISDRQAARLANLSRTDEEFHPPAPLAFD